MDRYQDWMFICEELEIRKLSDQNFDIAKVYHRSQSLAAIGYQTMRPKPWLCLAMGRRLVCREFR